VADSAAPPALTAAQIIELCEKALVGPVGLGRQAQELRDEGKFEEAVAFYDLGIRDALDIRLHKDDARWRSMCADTADTLLQNLSICKTLGAVAKDTLLRSQLAFQGEQHPLRRPPGEGVEKAAASWAAE